MKQAGLIWQRTNTRLQRIWQWRQRLTALFLFVAFLAGIAASPLSAYAASQPVRNSAVADAHRNQLPPDANKPMKTNYPGAEQPTVATTKAATDAQPTSGSPLAMLNKAGSRKGEPLQPVTSPPKITPHELTDKRTAISSVSVNADGSLTQKNYFTPQYFKQDGAWQTIDTSLVEDKNAGDSGNIFGQALGQVESWLSSTTHFIVKDNDWQARFAPSDSDNGMVRVKKGDSQVGFVPVNAKAVAPVVTTDKDGKQTVHYYDLWPGVNVEYTVESAAVKENIVIKDKDATNEISFKVIGASLEKPAVGDKAAPAYTIKGALQDEFAVAPPNLILNHFGFVSDTSVYQQEYNSGQLSVSVDRAYLQSLPDQAFPAVIDPTITSTFGTRQGGNYVSFKNDGYICYSNQCNLYAGSLYETGGALRYWRGAYFAPYDQFRNSGTILTNATLHLTQRSNESFWTGDWDTHNFQVGHATCLNSFNCVDGVWGSASFAGAGDINVTSLYQSRIAASDFNAWMMVMGEDGTTHSFKNFDPNNSYVTFTYGGPPPAPSIATPTSGQVYVDPQASFKVNQATNPNGSTPLKYEMLVSTGSGASGALITSGVMSAMQWTVPDGILQDGTTYYMQARSYDPITATYSGWGSSVPFRIDLRTGKDKTQTYDNLGPVDVDLATGNVATDAASHTSAALGGSLGVSLDYNSPLRSRTGLVGEYWNVASGYAGGAPATAPDITRVDQNVDFNWDTGSPASGTIHDDWFYARWSGDFVAPTTGTYYFGGNNDDLLAIYVNNQQLYSNGGCYTGVCYGTSIALQAGQVVPFRAEYMEATSPAYAHLYVKGPVDEQILPQTWLQTGVRPITTQRGLAGHYYFDDGTHNLDSTTKTLFMQRTDPLLNFAWNDGSPVANGPVDDFMVRWTGTITVPTTGAYQFGTFSDDGSRVKINGNTVYENWQDHAPTEGYGSAVQLTQGTSVPITVEYYEHTVGATFSLKMQGAGFTAQIVPSSWLSPKTQVLPEGWNLGVDPDGDLSYDRAKINQNSVVLTDSSGDTHEYTWTGTGYKPPTNEDGQLVRNADGTFTLQDTDGRTYVFNADGTLQSVTNPVDDRNPAALKYTYEGTPAKLTQITDGVDSNRWAKVYYSGDTNCGSAPAGYDSAAPTNMLCAVKTNDGRATYFYYTSGQLTRIARPGNELTDYQYEQVLNPSGVPIGYRLTGVRDALANDAVAAGVRANDDAAKTQLTYDILGRATSVKQPAATTGATRIEHTIEYLPGAWDKSYYGKTNQHVVGATEPNGFSRQVTYDNLFRTIQDTDIANLTAKAEWDANKDLLLSTTDPTGLKATTIYDDEDRPTDSYGPAPKDWFGTDRKPTSTYLSQVPHNESKYDENLWGPAVAWYNFKGNSLYGAPKLHTTGLGDSAGSYVFAKDMATAPVTKDTGMDGIGFSATGKLRVTQSGTFHFTAYHDDAAKLWIDDTLVFDRWSRRTDSVDGIGADITLQAGKAYRFRFDYATVNNPAAISLHLDGPGKTGPTAYFDGYLSPDYSLTTSTKIYDSTIGDTTATTSYGSNPELGLAQSTTIDPTGLNLSTSNTYETQGATGNYLRQLTKTLPGGGTTNYAYYTATETKDNPCTTGTTEAYKQAGFIKTKTEADPDAGGSQTGRVTETIYDDVGRVVASRLNNDPWTCTTYDSRGRVLTTAIPYLTMPLPDGGNMNLQARTVIHNYAVSGNPLVVASSDAMGAIITTLDLLGRTVSYTDNFNDTATTAYDNLGRLSSRTSPLGTETFVYDNYNRLTNQKLDGTDQAVLSYDSFGRLAHTAYPAAGSLSQAVTRDALGRTTGLTYYQGKNLVPNASVDQVSGSLPASWQSDAWGTNSATFTHLNEGHNGNRSLKTEITSYTDGDAKWYFNPVAVTPNTNYTFQDYYKSNIASKVVLRYTLQDSSYSYAWIGNVAASSDWVQTNLSFTTPSNATQVTALHLIEGVGWLTVDDADVHTAPTTALSDSVTRSQSGQILSGTELGQSKSYTYDKAGRLTAATIGSNTYSYSFGTPTGCIGTYNSNSGKNSNRTSQTINGVTTTYCYDYADRLISSASSLYNTPVYNPHGDMTKLGTNATPLRLLYDQTGRSVGFEQYDASGNGTAEYYGYDAQDRITYRETDNITGWNWQLTGDRYYAYTTPTDSPAFVRNANWDILEKYLQLPGGVLLTIRTATNKTYSLPNIHGDTMATADAGGTLLTTHLSGPFGEPVQGQTTPNNTTLSSSFGYVGSHQKITETSLTLTPIAMGARIYLPTLGRFTSVDPVEGGVENNYVYPGDPVNDFDLTGQCVGPVIVICIAVAGAVLTAGAISQASKNYQDDPTTSNLIWAGISMVPGMAATTSKGAARTAWGGAKSFARKINPFNGDEFVIGRIRIKPFGQWTAKNKDGSRNWSARLPHYHRQIKDSRGRTIPGGSPTKHRPWENGW